MTTLTSPEQKVKRDEYGRPYVIPVGGGKAIPYTRATTFVSALEDTYNLSRWQMRMVALGLSMRPDLLLAVVATDPGDKDSLNALCDQATEAAKAHAGATIGTALHALTERIDRGQDVGVVPVDYQADLDAYTEATKDLTATHIEAFCVLDTLKIAGTPDRVVKYQGRKFIADVKTGSIQYGILKIAMQLAVYARSHTYDVATAERSVHGAELDKGLIIHLPAGTGTCELVWVDLLEGWNAVIVARQVREKRGLSYRTLTTPFAPVDNEPVAVEPKALSIPVQIQACTTADEVRALWTPDWSEYLNNLARRHIADLT